MFSLINFLREMLFFAAYVSTNSSFPEPLSKAEEERLIDLYCNRGDDSARTMLIEHNLRLVAHISKKYIKTGIELDELISIGALGLVKAVSSFRPEKGALGTYSSRCIENEILMFLRTEKKHTTFEVSFEEPVGHDSDGNEVTLGDRLYSDDDDVQEDVYRHFFNERLENAARQALNDREYRVISMRYRIDGTKPYTQREIAKELGVSRSYISRIEKKALKKLSKYFTD